MKQGKNKMLATQELLKIILFMFPKQIHSQNTRQWQRQQLWTGAGMFFQTAKSMLFSFPLCKLCQQNWFCESH